MCEHHLIYGNKVEIAHKILDSQANKNVHGEYVHKERKL